MKRLNSYLLTHYPLLWNLRVHYIWPAILALHALFFLWGFSNAHVESLRSYRRFDPSGEVYTLAVLLSLLVLVIWIAMFFRNNAFKDFYPLKRGRLAAEAGLIFLTSLGLVSVSVSYSLGGSARVRQSTWGTDVEAEQQTMELARHFVPYNLQLFSKFRDCNPHSATTADTDSAGIGLDTFSYLNYCQQEVYWDEYGQALRNDNTNTIRARRWMRNGNRDSVEQLLNRYLALVRKYGGDHFFDVKAHTAAIFGGTRFELRYTVRAYRPNGQIDYNAMPTEETVMLREPDVDNGNAQAPALQYGDKTAYIEYGRAEVALGTIAAAQRGVLKFELCMLLLYIALSLTILIFSYRLTEQRAWFIALLGGGLWTVALGLCAAVLRNEAMTFWLLLILELAFTGVAIYAIHTGWKRRWAGVVYLWSFFFMPFFLPLLWFGLAELTKQRYDYSGSLRQASPLHEFLGAHEELCVALNLVLIALLMLLVYIPLARKWQAMPEE